MYLLTTTGAAQHFIQAFSWMLIHSLWQGLLLAVVTGFILMLTKRANAAVRYNLVFVQFLLFIIACAATFLWEWSHRPLQTAVPGLAGLKAAAPLLPGFNAAGIKAFAHTCMAYFTANAPLIMLLWFVFFLFRAVRMMGSLVYIYRAKHHLVYQSANEWKEKVNALCGKLQLNRAVQLLESGYVKMPMVIGHLKPIILVPVGLLAGLPAGQVEAVLLHELAHIRRNDYVVNFMQTIAETVFFFNPGLLWISSLLRDERENCCDDIALEQTKNKREFIEALISFKEHSLYGANYQVAFPGKKNHLLNRVSRILNNRNKTLAPGEKAFFMAGVIALSAMVATAAIAEVHTVAGKHKRPHVVTVSTTVKTMTTVPATAVDIKTSRHALHLPEPRLTKILPNPAAPQQPVNLVDALNKMQDKLRADQAALKPLSDQEQARIDQEQAKKDQEEARKDQAQALIDQAQAKKDEVQAIKDQEDAKRDQQATRDEEQAKKNQGQARLNDIQAKKNAEQVIRNEEQDRRNAEQAIRNEEQAKKNADQVIRNDEQAKRNQEQAKKNQVSVQE